MVQRILDAWFSKWSGAYSIVGYEHRRDAIIELFSTLKQNGFDWYKGDTSRVVTSFLLSVCVPRKKTRTKTIPEWQSDVKLDITKAAGLVFAADVSFAAAPPLPQVQEPEDPSPKTRFRPAKIDKKRVEEFKKRFFDGKTKEDLYS